MILKGTYSSITACSSDRQDINLNVKIALQTNNPYLYIDIDRDIVIVNMGYFLTEWLFS